MRAAITTIDKDKNTVIANMIEYADPAWLKQAYPDAIPMDDSKAEQVAVGIGYRLDAVTSKFVAPPPGPAPAPPVDELATLRAENTQLKATIVNLSKQVTTLQAQVTTVTPEIA